ncbi:pyruvate:ferredoxin (flavodoxin) oxidoreductase [Marinobacterium lutimaris]|uniref:Pyruvate-flavodoxin oxidoreductase n=1 Tax=Marinobacterium lutimaris TaxID=568106 RepID=A0A1H6CR85_9GAMM|nr:pyruvate:ferredoxin (flavodoxin) oxidoreductase [Marinobacterium lutimaris]SEG75532.1 pyruvate-ferredoxin/flavodoxin oxidoreductase [Marinobacterium lutimaris]
MAPEYRMMDGNEAAATIAHQLNDVIAIYPITPASPMGELCDAWSASGKTNLWGAVPDVIELQSEAGAAGAVHGSLQAGAKTCTFTASQGLLLKIPNMFKIAGELTPTVFHVAARSVATHALSIFCDHSDVMATRSTGFAILSSNTAQEAMDFACIAEMATLEGRVPVLHFFDGFRTSHEVSKVELISSEQLRELVPPHLVQACRDRGMSPNRPGVRGTSQNPDVFFQSREATNPFYAAFPGIVQSAMDRFAAMTGRQYRTFEYEGDPEAERVLVLMGSGAETAAETVADLNGKGEKVGVLKVRLFRPFDSQRLMAALPKSLKALAVLDRTKEPGADGEPLYKDVATALFQAFNAGQMENGLPRIAGGRFGLGSKEFTPAMVKAVFDGLKAGQLGPQFSVGIEDDVSQLSLAWDPDYRTNAAEHWTQAVFYGLGADGTVSANKNSIKIIGAEAERYAQGHFVYDSKKSGAVTVSHLRFGPKPIRAAYEIQPGQADFVAGHQPQFLDRYPMLELAREGATVLINTPLSGDSFWQSLPGQVQRTMQKKQLKVYLIDAYAVAQEAGLGKRINTIMQTCFFALARVIPKEEAIQSIKAAVEKSYGRRSRSIADMNISAIDNALSHLAEFSVPASDAGQIPMRALEIPGVDPFLHQVTAELIAGRGNALPVSKLPVDGAWPSGTAQYEKRDLALNIPHWEPDLCTHCGKCVLVCPHSVIRSKAFDAGLLDGAPDSFQAVPIKGAKDFPPDTMISYQLSPEDCTGCTLCVEICPISDKSNASRKAINMVPKQQTLAEESANWEFFKQLPEFDRTQVKETTLKGAMLYQPLFEFSGACSGCGETPYVRLLSQLYGDHMLVANATGCSSIYGGNLPTTPWSYNAEGRGPAWNNSLFEDNAEFGLGMRAALDAQQAYARALLESLAGKLDGALLNELINADESSESGLAAQRERIATLKEQLVQLDDPVARSLEAVADKLARHSVWIVGGDGWAYDIGYGGLDHVLASGRNVNILVLDTEVYSNTGGQTSKATPRAAVAKFSAGGKPGPKKDLARIAMDYEHVYVAHVAYAGKDVQTLRTFLEAESYDGPSLIIAYSPCIAHGYDLADNHEHQRLAVESGHWPLFRYDPRRAAEGQNPLRMDSKPPSIPYSHFARTEARFSMLSRTHPEAAKEFLDAAQHEVTERYHRYAQLAELSWEEVESPPEDESENPAAEEK